MKILKFIFIVLLVLVVLLAATCFVAVQMIKPERIRGLAEEELSVMLERKTTIESLSWAVSWKSGLNMEARGVQVAGLLEVDSVGFAVDAQKFIWHKEIVVPRMIIHQPKLVWSALTPPKDLPPAAPTPRSSKVGSFQENKASQQTGSGDLPDFEVNEISIRDGELRVHEQIDGQPLDIKIGRINLDVKDFGLDRYFPYTLSFAVFSNERPLVEMTGEAQIQKEARQLHIRDLTATVDLVNLNMKDLRQALKNVEATGLTRIQQGQLIVRLPELRVDPAGLQSLRIRGALKDVTLALEQIPSSVTFNADLTADRSDMQLTDMMINMDQGRIHGKASVRDYLGEQDFQASVQAEGVRLMDLVDVSQFDMQIRADLNGSVNLTGRGFDQPSLENHLRGEATLRVSDGRILDFNLLDFVMGKFTDSMASVPMLSQVASGLKENLSRRYQEQFTKQDTVFDVTDVMVKVAAGHLVLGETDFGMEGHVVKISGDMDFSGRLEMLSSLFLSADLAQRLADQDKTFQYLRDDQGRIQIPFAPYAGPVTDLGPPNVNLKGLLKKVYETRGKQELRDVLRKALELEEPAKPSVSGTQGTDIAPAKTREEKPEDVLLDVLDGFLDKL